MAITAEQIKQIAHACGFELCGVTAAIPHEDFERFESWRTEGMAGEMAYLTDRRGDIRSDPRHLLPSAKSIVCLGKLYNSPYSKSIDGNDRKRGWISRYAWGGDYHDVMRDSMESLIAQLRVAHPEPFEARICVDTAPLLERSYARTAGLGWIGKNTCLINQERGSWFFLGEVLLSIPLHYDVAPPERCGTCSRCIDACPTNAIGPTEDGGWRLDGRLCISYLTIEKRGEIPTELHQGIGNHIFGCDICQDVCPWNRRAPVTSETLFFPNEIAPDLESLSGLTEEEFKRKYRKSPIRRAKYSGFLRNIAIARSNSVRDLTDWNYTKSSGESRMPVDTQTSKQTFYQQLCQQLEELLGQERSLIANAANTSAFLFQMLPDVNWAGFYLAQRKELVLGPFQGKPACVRIPFGEGVCGTAAVQGETVVVPDVHQFPGHITCDPASQSEIAIPLLNWGRLIGVLDIDSASLNRFDEDDREGLESLMSVFLSSQETFDLPDLSDDAVED